MTDADMILHARSQAQQIGDAGHNGWGNMMVMLADRVEALTARAEAAEAKWHNPNAIEALKHGRG